MNMDKAALREAVSRLDAALNEDDDTAIEVAVAQVTKLHHEMFFEELGRLTREVHETLASITLDSELKNLTEDDLPDVKDRLQFVIKTTEESAHRTMTAVETLLPLQEDIASEAEEFFNSWEKLYRREMRPHEFSNLARKLQEFLKRLQSDTAHSRDQLREILMAQEYQDIVGQVIRRVLEVLQELEERLLEMVKKMAPYSKEKDMPDAAEKSATDALEGPQIHPEKSDDVVKDQDEVDSLLASLGF